MIEKLEPPTETKGDSTHEYVVRLIAKVNELVDAENNRTDPFADFTLPEQKVSE